MQAYRSSTCRRVTLSDRMPPPTGVVSGPLIETRNSCIASTVPCGSQSWNRVNAFSPANTSIQATRRSPPNAFSIAASNTRTEARQMSAPVPSPSTYGMIGLFGTSSAPFSYAIRSPVDGTRANLYVAMTLAKKRAQHPPEPLNVSATGRAINVDRRERQHLKGWLRRPRAASSTQRVCMREWATWNANVGVPHHPFENPYQSRYEEPQAALIARLRRSRSRLYCRGQRVESTLTDARGETRTRKARRPGDFESPASTNSATRARVGMSHERYSRRGPRSTLGIGYRRRPPATAGARGRGILLELLDLAVEALAHGRELPTLHWREKPGQLLLLTLQQVGAPPLRLHELVHEL